MRSARSAGGEDASQLILSEGVFRRARGLFEVDAVAGIVCSDSLRDEPAEVVLDRGEAADEGGLAPARTIPGAPFQHVGLGCEVGAESVCKEEGYVVEVTPDGERRKSFC